MITRKKHEEEQEQGRQLLHHPHHHHNDDNNNHSLEHVLQGNMTSSSSRSSVVRSCDMRRSSPKILQIQGDEKQKEQTSPHLIFDERKRQFRSTQDHPNSRPSWQVCGPHTVGQVWGACWDATSPGIFTLEANAS